jgi:shikimate kinase
LGSREQGSGKADSLALIGFMGAGKSAVGAILSSELEMEFVDLDEVISREAGRSIEKIFASEGEEGFRERESAALESELCSGGKVLSCGGGLVLRQENVRLLRRRCRVYLLEISRSKAVERIKGTGGRPLLAGGDLEAAVERLMDERAELYGRAAHETVDANEASPPEIAGEIAARWRKYECGRREENTPST